jgi:hypothetical protein
MHWTLICIEFRYDMTDDLQRQLWFVFLLITLCRLFRIGLIRYWTKQENLKLRPKKTSDGRHGRLVYNELVKHFLPQKNLIKVFAWESNLFSLIFFWILPTLLKRLVKMKGGGVLKISGLEQLLQWKVLNSTAGQNIRNDFHNKLHME